MCSFVIPLSDRLFGYSVMPFVSIVKSGLHGIQCILNIAPPRVGPIPSVLVPE